MNKRVSPFFTGFSGTVMPLLMAAAVVVSIAVQASDGHDHGDTGAPAAGTASPRVTGHSDLFELVGVVDNGAMTIYLDRFSTNEPVTGARVEVEAGTAKGIAAAQADGTYRFEHAVLKQAGVLPVSFTVTDRTGTDLLAGDLTLGEPADGHDHDHAPSVRPWLRWAAWAVGGLAVLAVLSLATVSIRRRSRRASTL